MKNFKKSTAMLLALIMCFACFAVFSPVSAAEGNISYSAYDNAVILSGVSEINSVSDVLKLADEKGADTVIVYSTGNETMSVKFSKAAVDELEKSDISVKFMIPGKTLYLTSENIDEINAKTTMSFEVALDGVDAFKISLKADGQALVLAKKLLAVGTTDDTGINNVVGENGNSIARSYISGVNYYVCVNGDISVKAIKADTPVFNDMKTHWAESNVNYVTTRGYFNGMGDGKFVPYGNMTRAMVATVLSRIDGAADGEFTYSYNDVDKNAWFAKGVNWAYENKIVGEMESFRPDEPILRIELMEMLYNYAVKLGLAGDITVEEGGLDHFLDKDALTSEFSRKAVYFCTQNSIVGGYSAGPNVYRLRPDGKATRAEVAAMIQRFMDYSVLGGLDLESMNGKYSKFINARGDLTNLYNKINSGEEVVVSYLGGSVTDGYGATSGNSWRDLTFKWLKNSFPNGKIKQNAVAMGGSGIHLGAYRVGPDVIDTNTDLLFVEFSVNDSYSGTAGENRIGFYFEKLVREVREALPECEIIAIYITDQGMAQKYGVENMHDNAKAYEKICEAYGITSIDVGRAVIQEMGGKYSGELWPVYFKDGVHPLDPGYKVFADAITEYLGKYLCGMETLSYGESKAHTMPTECVDILTANSTLTYIVANDESVFDSIEGYTIVKDAQFFACTKTRGYIFATAENNQFTVTFEGTDFGMYLEYAGGGYWIEYSVDGGTPERKLINNTNHPFKLVSGLESGKHTITYKYLGENAEFAVNNARKIGTLLIGDIKK